MDWQEILPAKDCSYVLGNPPFRGALKLSEAQTRDRKRVFDAVPESKDLRSGRLDYVNCWYAKAFQYLKGQSGRAAFVSTNSITQGEQARSMGPLMTRMGFAIDFAHRTFNWSSEARGKAIVHVVIIGFSYGGVARTKTLFEYPDIRALPKVSEVSHINWWLVAAPDVVLKPRSAPFFKELPRMTVGSQPTDGQHLLVMPQELAQVKNDPIASKYLRRYFGAREMLNGTERHCLWLVDAPPQDLRNSPVLRERLKLVSEARRDSPTPAFQRAALTPHLFTHRKQPDVPFIAVPQNSSDNRRWIPAAIYSKDAIASNKATIIYPAHLWMLALVQSQAFQTWVRMVGGRLKSDPTITADLAYNAFPWPDLNDRSKANLAGAAEAVLAARSACPGATLSDLYDSISMPPDLVAAHIALDKMVDGLYGWKKVPTEAERAAKLFGRYADLSASEGLTLAKTD